MAEGRMGPAPASEKAPQCCEPQDPQHLSPRSWHTIPELSIQRSAPGTPHPAFHTLHPTLSTQHSAPGTQHPSLCTQHSVLSTQYLAPDTPHPTPSTPDSAPHTQYPAPGTPHPAPHSQFPSSRTPHPASLTPLPALRIPLPVSLSLLPSSRIPLSASHSPHPAPRSRSPHPTPFIPHPSSRIPLPSSRSPHPAPHIQLPLPYSGPTGRCFSPGAARGQQRPAGVPGWPRVAPGGPGWLWVPGTFPAHAGSISTTADQWCPCRGEVTTDGPPSNHPAAMGTAMLGWGGQTDHTLSMLFSALHWVLQRTDFKMLPWQWTQL